MISKFKIITILGTRPEIIRLSLIIKKLDKLSNHIIIHTGQNYDFELDKVFFKNFKLRKPNYFLKAKGSFHDQLSIISKKLGPILDKEKPDKFLVLGDTNSSLGAIIAKRMQIPVYHMEAGNRCFDNRVPEEVNRKIIDSCSDILLPYTKRSKENLVAEGYHRRNIFVTGNPIYEVIESIKNDLNSKILKKLNLSSNNFILLTLHRTENVDDSTKLKKIINFISKISIKTNCQVIWPIHPRTKKNILKSKIKLPKSIKIFKPLDFVQFITLEKSCKFIITDSGTVQEEAAIFNKFCITIRDTTERPEIIENGNNFVTGFDEKFIENSILMSMSYTKNTIPLEYISLNVSEIVINILLSYQHKTPA